MNEEGEIRCSGCKSLCADPETLSVHERYCRKKQKQRNMIAFPKDVKDRKRIVTCIEIPSAQCGPCEMRTKNQHRCLEGHWS